MNKLKKLSSSNKTLEELKSVFAEDGTGLNRCSNKTLEELKSPRSLLHVLRNCIERSNKTLEELKLAYNVILHISSSRFQ